VSTWLLPRRRPIRASCRQQPGQQPHSGDRHETTERLPMRRHDDRAPPGRCRDRLLAGLQRNRVHRPGGRPASGGRTRGNRAVPADLGEQAISGTLL